MFPWDKELWQKKRDVQGQVVAVRGLQKNPIQSAQIQIVLVWKISTRRISLDANLMVDRDGVRSARIGNQNDHITAAKSEDVSEKWIISVRGWVEWSVKTVLNFSFSSMRTLPCTALLFLSLWLFIFMRLNLPR